MQKDSDNMVQHMGGDRLNPTSASDEKRWYDMWWRDHTHGMSRGVLEVKLSSYHASGDRLNWRIQQLLRCNFLRFHLLHRSDVAAK